MRKFVAPLFSLLLLLTSLAVAQDKATTTGVPAEQPLKTFQVNVLAPEPRMTLEVISQGKTVATLELVKGDKITIKAQNFKRVKTEQGKKVNTFTGGVTVVVLRENQTVMTRKSADTVVLHRHMPEPKP